ncbi:MAG: TlpA disulfide reductase family protein [Planctomycetota bacterium]
MLPRPLLFCLVVASLLFSAATPTAALTTGDPVQFAAKTLDDRVIKAEDYRGQLLVVHFWSTWHRPSVRQLETLRAVLDHTAPLGVAMVGICLDDADEGTVMMQTMLAGVTAAMSESQTWDHTLGQSQMPALDTRFFTENYAIPAVWIVSPEGEALWQGHPSELPEQLIGFLETHPPTVLPDGAMADAEGEADEVAEATAEAEPAEPKPITVRVIGEEIDATAALAAMEAKADAGRAAQAALLEADVAWNAETPDYAAALAAFAAIDPMVYDQPLIAAHGQRWERVIQNLEPDQRDALLAARDALPEAGFTLDAYLAAAGDVDPMQGSTNVADAQRVTQRIERGMRSVEREKHADAYETFSALLRVALGVPEADEALIRVLRYEADEELMAAIEIEKSNNIAQGKLMMARAHIENFNEEQAAALLRDIMETHPETPTAQVAEELLSGLDLPE